MTTTQKIEKLEREVIHLKSLFSALIPLDREGHYKDSFVKKIKKSMSERATGTYTGKGSLLKLRK